MEILCGNCINVTMSNTSILNIPIAFTLALMIKHILD